MGVIGGKKTKARQKPVPVKADLKSVLLGKVLNIFFNSILHTCSPCVIFKQLYCIFKVFVLFILYNKVVKNARLFFKGE